jgi:uncharacterized protein YdhG (YjbR/CyaY superfamily)
MAQQHASVDDYIASLPADTAEVLEEVRRVILLAAPGAVETVGYGMPQVSLDGRGLIHFAAWKEHVALYGGFVVDPELEGDLAPYRAAMGTLRFSLSQPIPLPLIERLVAALVRQRRDDPA